MLRNFLTLLLSISILAGCQTINRNYLSLNQPSDNAITATVTQEFMNNSILHEVPVQVETHQGTVTLSGYVKTIRQSDTAGEIAAKVPGVKFVQNNLIVRK